MLINNNNKEQEQTGGPKSELCNFYVAAFLLIEQPKLFPKAAQRWID